MLRRTTNGFTLLELMLSLAMMALLTAVMFSSLYIAFHARESATRALESVQKMSNSMTLLSQDFYGAMLPTGILAGAFSGASPAGSDSGQPAMGAGSGGLSTSNSSLNSSSSNGGPHAASNDPGAVVLLSFFSTSNTPRDGELGGDVRKIELSLETPDGSTKPALMRRVYYNLLPSRNPEPKVQVLCRDVRNFSIRYYDGSLWYTTWDSGSQNNTLPLAAEVTLEFDGPDSKPGDAAAYKITRVFAIPCGVTAAASSGSTTQ